MRFRLDIDGALYTVRHSQVLFVSLSPSSSENKKVLLSGKTVSQCVLVCCLGFLQHTQLCQHVNYTIFDTRDIPGVAFQDPLCLKDNRGKITQIMVESFSITTMYVASQLELALSASEQTVALSWTLLTDQSHHPSTRVISLPMTFCVWTSLARTRKTISHEELD